MNLRLAVAAVTILSLAACSPSAEPAPVGPAVAASSEPGAGPATTESATTVPVAEGDCDLLSAADVGRAFGGKLTVRKSSGRGTRGGGCTYSIAEVSESQLVVQVENEEGYAARKDAYARNSAVPMSAMTLGKEAFVVNGAQVIALREDGQAISLGLMLIVFNQPSPLTDEEVRSGMESLARTAFERM
jgi:hypothetical protein